MLFVDDKRFSLEGLFKDEFIQLNKKQEINKNRYKNKLINPKDIKQVQKNYEKSSIMFQAAIFVHGQAALIKIKDILNTEKYKKLLNNNLLNHFYIIFGGNNFFLVSDNASCHKSKKRQNIIMITT